MAGRTDGLIRRAIALKLPHGGWYLAGRPVRARRDSWAYRVRKFVSRNRAATLAAATSLVLILVGAGVAVWQAREARCSGTARCARKYAPTPKRWPPVVRRGSPAPTPT